MALQIVAKSFFESKYLRIKGDLVIVPSLSFLGGKRRYTFDQIDYVLMTANNVLSFQAGQDVFSIQTRPYKPKHQAVLQALREGLCRTVGGPAVAVGS